MGRMLKIPRRVWLAGVPPLVIALAMSLIVMRGFGPPSRDAEAEIQPANVFYTPRVVKFPNGEFVMVQLRKTTVDELVRQVNAEKGGSGRRTAGALSATMTLLDSEANAELRGDKSVNLANAKWFWHFRPGLEGFHFRFKLDVDNTEVTRNGSLTFRGGVDVHDLVIKFILWVMGVVGAIVVVILEEWVRRRWWTKSAPVGQAEVAAAP